jgi:hypothetical protein
LNFIINRYNDTRAYLPEPMKEINYIDGYTVSYRAIDVNKVLNPNTYSKDPTLLKVNTSTFGVKLRFSTATEV